MPNYITHVFFARDVQKELSIQDQLYLSSCQSLYEVGANGPDLLYFHGLNRRILHESKVRDLGHMVHRKKVNDFYKEALNQIEQDSIHQRESLIYLCGHVTHWALDAYVHPYVYYRCRKGTEFSSMCHHRLEALMDSCLLEERKFIPHDELNQEQLSVISSLYSSISKNVYQHDMTKEEIEESYLDWKQYRKKQKVASSVYPIDPLNEQHHVWHHPCDNTVHTESFYDLYEQAKKEAVQAVGYILNQDINGLLNQIQDRNYAKGRKNSIPMRYFVDKVRFQNN